MVQKCILLGLVETMDFIDEQYGFLSIQRPLVLGDLDDGSNFLYTRQHG